MSFKKVVIKEGHGRQIKHDDYVTVHFTGYGKNNDLTQIFWSTKYDGQKPFRFKAGVGSVIKGLDEGILTMKLEEVANFTITSDYAYGESGYPMYDIKPNSTLVLVIEVLKIE